MKVYNLLSMVFVVIFFVGCQKIATTEITLKHNIHQGKKVDFLSEVKPILDKRCVSCHSCYNSPCQAKYSSFEGVDRGASKDLVYDATRLLSTDPTRLFFDAQSTEEWRDMDFYSLTQSLDPLSFKGDSIMAQMLNDKRKDPFSVGTYSPEEDKLICPKDQREMQRYRQKKPHHGMPYGFPVLEKVEHQSLIRWLSQGAKGPSIAEQRKITSPSNEVAKEIMKWEHFLNTSDAKHAMTARYLYEHYFLAHINFKIAPMEFYELVRSKTAYPQQIEIISTLRPFEDPKVQVFYYRFRRIHSTIVHKTHMVVTFDDREMASIKKLFIQSKWSEAPHRVGYDIDLSTNPFLAFAQIPVRSRYQFLLNHNHYIVRTFIRGPVCRGQMALNVIHDHFWVMFQDPDYDLSVLKPEFLIDQATNLETPIKKTTMNIFDTFNDTYRNKYERYFEAKERLYSYHYPKGVGLEGIWRGESPKDTPLLTIYRHFNSASVHKGVIGELPRTMWVIDYPQLERIYYALVAGYDVYGNVSHQTNIRRYMDFLRMEGEANFLSYMPPSVRLNIFKSWYIGDKTIEQQDRYNINRGSGVRYKTKYYKNEFIEKVVDHHILKEVGIKFDPINYFRTDQHPPKMPKTFHNYADFKRGLQALTAPGRGFLRQISDYDINLLHLRVDMPNGKSRVSTMVINRWHDNVNSLFGEEKRLDSKKDTFDFIPYSVGSYPNIFVVINYKDLPDFFDLIENFDGSEKYQKKIKKYFVNRADKRFWKIFDWFQKNFNESDPIEAGLYDLNRYFPKVW